MHSEANVILQYTCFNDMKAAALSVCTCMTHLQTDGRLCVSYPYRLGYNEIKHSVGTIAEVLQQNKTLEDLE